jgi:hypothetical protein
MNEGFTILRGPDRHVAQRVLDQSGLIGAAHPFYRKIRSAFPVPDLTAEHWLRSFVTALKPKPDDMEVRGFLRKNGRVLPYALGNGILSIDTALNAHRAWATIVFQKIDSLLPKWHRVARAFEGASGQPVQMNLYVGPSNQPGLDWHCDPHDVIVQQLFGEKQFDLAETLEDNASGRDDKIILRAGDLLAMARGTPHRVMNGPSGSIHLSIGFLHLHKLSDQNLARCTDAGQLSVTTRCFETMPPSCLRQTVEFLMRWRGKFSHVGDPLALLLNDDKRYLLRTTNHTREIDRMTALRMAESSETVVEYFGGGKPEPIFNTALGLLTHGWSTA